ncbi:MAG TPA: YciC family protein [Gaiella sp.]|nr:YciC family protein [Gaiella sp.]
MTIGAVLDESWTLFTRFFLRFFLIGIVVFAVVNLVYALLVEAISSDDVGAGLTLAILGLAAAVIGTTWLQGAFVYAVQDARDGTLDSTIGEIFSRVSPSIVPLFVAGLLAGIAIGIGFILLIVPGLYLLTIWAVIAPVIVIERTGALDAFGRSRELVRGHGWTVLGIVVIAGVLSSIASGLLQAAFSFLPRFLEIVVGNTIAQAVVSPFVAIALAITYFRLCEAHEEAAQPQPEL